MSKIIIYDNKNILIAELEGKIEQETIGEIITQKQYIRQVRYTANFREYKLISSFSLQKQLKKIEKIFKFHKEGGRNVKKSI